MMVLIVASNYCYEFDHTYKLGKSPSPSKQSGFTTMDANADNTSKLWHQHLGHTNFGTLHHMSCLMVANGLPQIEAPNGLYE